MWVSVTIVDGRYTYTYLCNGGNSDCKTSTNDKLDEAEEGRSPDVDNELNDALHCSQAERVYLSTGCHSRTVKVALT